MPKPSQETGDPEIVLGLLTSIERNSAITQRKLAESFQTLYQASFRIREPVGLRKMVRDLERTHMAMGDGVKRLYKSELPARQRLRRVIA